jgi:hypothetical protein
LFSKIAIASGFLHNFNKSILSNSFLTIDDIFGFLLIFSQLLLSNLSKFSSRILIASGF